jgi:hypothetical protein
MKLVAPNYWKIDGKKKEIKDRRKNEQKGEINKGKRGLKGLSPQIF